MMVAGPGSETHDPLQALLSRESLRLPRVWGGPATPGLVVDELRRGTRLRASNLLVGGLPEGRIETAPLQRVIRDFHPERWARKPLWVTATDVRSGRRAVFGRADEVRFAPDVDEHVDLGTAVRASCAVPGFFAPVEIGGRKYIDGGMRSPDNADLLLDGGFDLVVISSPLSVDRVRLTHSPAVTALRTYPRRQLRRNVRALRAAGAEVLVLQPDPGLARAIGINAMRPSKLQPIVSASVVAMSRSLASLERVTEPSPTRRAYDLLTSVGARPG